MTNRLILLITYAIRAVLIAACLGIACGLIYADTMVYAINLSIFLWLLRRTIAVYGTPTQRNDQATDEIKTHVSSGPRQSDPELSESFLRTSHGTRCFDASPTEKPSGPDSAST